MAQPANTFDSYDYANAINEDISQIIHNVTPFDTPFYSKCRKTTASNTLHEWLTSCLLYTSPSPRDVEESRMPSSA